MQEAGTSRAGGGSNTELEAGTSRAGGRRHNAQGGADTDRLRTGISPGRPPNPATRTSRPAQFIALKEGDPIPEGYALVVDTTADPVPSARMQQRNQCDTVDLSTPPKANVPSTEEGPDTAKSKMAARRNLTRNSNRKANATFAKELKESLATGQPTPIKLAEDNTDLKCTWHAAAKELAYKFLDLTKESWKDYSIFEKNMVHNELKEQFKFATPIDPKRVDKYLSSHLRTSRAVWKGHWKKNGPAVRHHNCPQAAWDRLCKWWPTAACQEEAAKMASRRARVERNSKVGRSSLLDRMEESVSTQPSTRLGVGCLQFFFWGLLVMNGCGPVQK